MITFTNVLIIFCSSILEEKVYSLWVFSGSSYGLLCYSYEKIDDNTSMAQIRFLNTKDAPDVLYIGAKIELYEGNKKVANGEVISNSGFRFGF